MTSKGHQSFQGREIPCTNTELGVDFLTVGKESIICF